MRNASAFISSTSKRASFHATQAPRLPHHTTSQYQRLKNKIQYVLLFPPPANMANPWFGSDVAAREYLATLRAAVVHAAGHCSGCAAAMLMKHSITVTAGAAVW
jgi:hypothetical protein